MTFAPAARGRSKGTALAEHMVSEYLRPWEVYERPEHLREAWRLARIVGGLHQLISYRYIVVGHEALTQWENDNRLSNLRPDC